MRQITERIYEAESELEKLESLLIVITEQVEAITDHVDPARAAKLAADLARIAFDCAEIALGRLRQCEEGLAMTGTESAA